MQRTDSDGWEVVDLFGNFDTDGDFYLSFDEALPLIRLMSEFKEVVSIFNFALLSFESFYPMMPSHSRFEL